MDADSAATRGGRHPSGHPQGAAGEADYCKALIVRKVHQPQARLSTSNSGLVCRLVALVRWGWSSAVPRTRKVSNFLLLHLCPTQIICHQQTNIPGPALSLKTPKKLNHALRGCDDVLHCLPLDIYTKTAALFLFVSLLANFSPRQENTTSHAHFLFLEFSVHNFSQSKRVNAKCRRCLNVSNLWKMENSESAVMRLE